jgi:hypothetical protein
MSISESFKSHSPSPVMVDVPWTGVAEKSLETPAPYGYNASNHNDEDEVNQQDMLTKTDARHQNEVELDHDSDTVFQDEPLPKPEILKVTTTLNEAP